MTRYLKSIILTYVCLFPFSGMGQPSWINDGLMIHIPFNGSIEDVVNGSTMENIGVTLDIDRTGSPNGSGKFVELDRTGLKIKKDQIQFEGKDYTFSVWIKEVPRSPDGSDYNQIIGIENEDERLFWSFSLLYDWAVRPVIRLNQPGLERGYSAFDLVTGMDQSLEWNHVVLTIRNGYIYRLYVNGRIKNWISQPSLGLDVLVPTGDLFIGQSFDGLIDDFKFYRTTLSDDQVRELYLYESFKDSDGDGLYDFEEIKIGSDPNKRDTDGDRLIDGKEIEIGSNPILRDSDLDGYDDFFEYRNLSDPSKIDSDGDGFEDFQEFENNSDPSDPESVPSKLLIYPSIELNFATVKEPTYQLQYSPNLVNWINYQDSFQGTGNKVTMFVSIKNTDMKYFRLTRVVDLNE